MGLQLDTMCCINNEDIVFHKRKQQDEQCYNNSCNGNNDSDDTTSQFIPIERNLNKTYTKPHLPSSEIKFYTNNDYMSIKRVKSLSTLPISTSRCSAMAVTSSALNSCSTFEIETLPALTVYSVGSIKKL